MPTVVQSYWSATRLQPLYRPGQTQQISVKLPASVTYPAGQVLGEVTATPGVYKAYLAAATDGSQNPMVLLEYSCTTDAAGNISQGGDFGQVYSSTPAYMPTNLSVLAAELTGLDAAGLSKMGGVILEGTITSGTILFG